MTLLAVTRSTVDVVGMQEESVLPSCYRLGHKRWGGCDFAEAKIVFVTEGLLLRWYATQGSYAFRSFDGILVDEMDQMATSPEYALLWEVAVKISTRRLLHISGASATFSSATKKSRTKMPCMDRMFRKTVLC